MDARGPAHHMRIVGSVGALRIVAAPQHDSERDACGTEKRLERLEIVVEVQFRSSDLHIMDVDIEVEECRSGPGRRRTIASPVARRDILIARDRHYSGRRRRASSSKTRNDRPRQAARCCLVLPLSITPRYQSAHANLRRAPTHNLRPEPRWRGIRADAADMWNSDAVRTMRTRQKACSPASNAGAFERPPATCLGNLVAGLLPRGAGAPASLSEVIVDSVRSDGTLTFRWR
jgi:hypothetical protein